MHTEEDAVEIEKDTSVVIFPLFLGFPGPWHLVSLSLNVERAYFFLLAHIVAATGSHTETKSQRCDSLLDFVTRSSSTHAADSPLATEHNFA